MSSYVTTFHGESTDTHEVFHSSKRTKFCTALWWMLVTSVVSGGQHLNSLARCTWMLSEPTLRLEMTFISQMCNIPGSCNSEISSRWKTWSVMPVFLCVCVCAFSYVLKQLAVHHSKHQQTCVFFPAGGGWSVLTIFQLGFFPPRMWWYTVLPSVHVNKMAPGWKHCNWWTAPRYRLEGNIGIDWGVTQTLQQWVGFNILNQAGSRFAQSLQCNLQQWCNCGDCRSRFLLCLLWA